MEKKKKYVLCTLFNSVYMDKGIVLYHSLSEVTSDFILYVLCMDDKCYEVLSDLKYEHLMPIRLTDFENEKLCLSRIPFITPMLERLSITHLKQNSDFIVP